MTMNQQCEIHTEKIDQISKDVIAVKQVLNGNGKMGLVGRVIKAEEWIERARARRDGFYTWAFRIFITLLLVKLGIK